MKMLVFVTLVLTVSPVHAAGRLPVIDMHLHAQPADAQGPPPLAMCMPLGDPFPAWDPAMPYGEAFMAVFRNPPCDDPVWSPKTDDEVLERTVAVMKRANVYGVLAGTPERLDRWTAAAPGRFIPATVPKDASESTFAAMRAMHAAGKLAALSELAPQYGGLAPDHENFEPYWKLAEELDIPVGIHIGPGPPGVIYLGSSRYRARLHSALALEEVLVRHPKLRVFVMHAGYPFLEDTLALLYAHPQVYVEVGIIVYAFQRPAFYRFLQGLVEGGFANRVMFGSDQMVWPELIERSIAVIEEAPFLSAEQKRDILYDNAARFLRLSDEEIARHHKEAAAP